jgi:hypothetical protein
LGETPWILPDYLIFSNGWAAYRIHTIHDGKDVGDTTVLRTSDGNYYLSHLHFCVGIIEDMEASLSLNKSSPPPADAKDFIEHFGKRQEWNLMAKDNRLWCVINFPREPHYEQGKKTFWVWIVSNEGTNQVTIFDRRYVVTGSYVSWNTHWFTNDSLAIDVYDHGQDVSPRMYPESGQSNLITSLTLFRDRGTGKFTEKN